MSAPAERTPQEREAWARAFEDKAAAYWTPERLHELIRDKSLAVTPANAPVLLRALGLLHRDASMPAAEVRKFRQINHLVAQLGPAMAELRERSTCVTLLDAGCGRSYLTMLLAFCFERVWNHPARILGVDRMEHVVDASRARAMAAALPSSGPVALRFEAADLAHLDLASVWSRAFGEPIDSLDGLVSLHACDTATDAAIAVGLRLDAQWIAVAPCCQAELAAKWAHKKVGMAGVADSPHLRRALGAHVTDAMRRLLLRSAGYDAEAIEFVSGTHTPKNTLIRGQRRRTHSARAWADYRSLKETTGGQGIVLEELLPAALRARLSAGDPGVSDAPEG